MKNFGAWVLSGVVLILIGCSGTDVGRFLPGEAEDSVLIADDITANPNIQLKKSPGSKSKYDDIYQKTLFSPDRVFSDTENDESSVEPDPTPARMQIHVPNLELVGTLQKTEDKSSYAFIKNASDTDPAMRNKVRRYGQGEWIGDYLISLIEASRVILIRGEEIAMLQLKPTYTAGRPPARGGGRAPAAAAAAAAGGGGRQAAQPRTSAGAGQRRPQTQAEREKEEDVKRTREMEAAAAAETRFTGRGRQMQQDNAASSQPSGGVRGATAPYWAWSESQSGAQTSVAPGRRGCGR